MGGILDSLLGGGSSGGGSTNPDGTSNVTATTTTDLPDWLKGDAINFLKMVEGLVAPGGRLAQFPQGLNQQVAPFTPYQNTALQGFGNITPQATALTGAGGRMLGDTLSGKYLDPNTNPYLKATYDQAAQGVTDQYRTAIAPSTMASAQLSGQMGGSAYNQLKNMDQYSLGQNLNNLATDIYGGNYQQERLNQLRGEQMLPATTAALYQPYSALLGAGTFQQQQNQDVLNTNYANNLAQAEWPFSLLSFLGSALGQAGGGTGTSTSMSTIPNLNQGGNTAGALGAGSLIGGALLPGLLSSLGSIFGGGGGMGGGKGGGGLGGGGLSFF